MLLNNLNQEQRIAAEQTEGAVMIIAGAGSGKTRTLTYRIAHLIEKGVEPFNILALTFTNKAANEMKERVVDLVGNDAKNIMMGTFHSVFSKILRVEAERIGYVSNFTIYDTDNSKSVIKSIVKDYLLDQKIYNISYILDRISKAKSSLISPIDYLENIQLTTEDRATGKALIGRIYFEYNQRLRRSMAMDFDDLLFNMNVLLRDSNDVLLKYQNKFRYIHVDEYQDTNYSQFLIVKKLAARFRNICVVGDDAQSIYAFRGANIQNILNFKKDYQDCKLIKLEQNYRSTQNIVNAANSLISKNKDQIKKEVWTNNSMGNKINFKECDNEKKEAQWIINSIRERVSKNDCSYSNFAILYRTNQQSRALEEAFRLENVPYRIFSGTSFYSRREIKDVIAYFRLVVNNKDDEAFLRVVNFPVRGIGDTNINRLKILASENNISLFEAVENINSYSHDISSRAMRGIIDFIIMIKSFSINLYKLDAYDLGLQIIQAANLIRYWKEDPDPLSDDRADNISEMLNAIKSFVEAEETMVLDQLTGEEISVENKTLDVFLAQVSLMSETDRDDKEDSNRVSLMTIHASKGLEYKYVFVSGIEENLFPSVMSLASRADIEEERRLFYVAMTRAETELFLSCSVSRYKNGQLNFNEKSRFLEEIDEKYLDEKASVISSNPFPTKIPSLPGFPVFSQKNKLKPLSPLPKPIGGDTVNIDDYFIGMVVFHDKFGRGLVLNLDGQGDNTKAEVKFEVFGIKKLVLRFAKLKKV